MRSNKLEYNISPSWRFNLVRYATVFFCVLIVLRLFQIQIINESKYKAQAREQQWKGYPIKARRGHIYTSDMYPIATTQTSYDLYINKQSLPNNIDLSKLLRQYIEDIDTKRIKQFQKSDKSYIKIAENIDWRKKSDLEDLKIPGLTFQETYDRYYPESRLLSHVLGFVGKDKDGNDVGYFGLEQYYDGDLRGQDGWLLQERTAGGDPILWGGLNKIPAVDGSDLYLTIDRNVQFHVEKKLEEGVKRYAAVSGSVIIVNPSTGAIIAMASYPSFDPKDYEEAVEDEFLVRNNCISVIYEPGSVMKGLTMSSAIDMGKVTPTTTYMDDGPKYFSGHLVDNWDGKHHGEETMVEVLQHSNNLGAAWVGHQIGGKNLMRYFTAFGLGQYTGIDLEGEEKGIIYTHFPMKDIELANAAFGQGVAVTPLQLVMGFSAIANDGRLMRPYVVSGIVSNDAAIETKPEMVDRPISEETAETMVYMLTQAVSGGEAKFFVSKRYSVAGKTGTAQIPVENGYDPDRTNATFVGFFSSYKNFVMLVKLEEPKFPSGYAAETAVPLWMGLAEYLGDYYKLSPDKEL